MPGLDPETRYYQKPFTALRLTEAVRRAFDGGRNCDASRHSQALGPI